MLMKRSHLGRRVTVLGARGFIGSAVVAALEAREGIAVTGLVRRYEGTKAPGFGRSLVLGDVSDEDSVRRAVRGADCVVHAASYIGYDPRLCEQTNVLGTQVVATACAKEGIRRLVYVSTAAVYGPGPHRNAQEGELTVKPASMLSSSRALAEDTVLSMGGAVVRPHFVYGIGDRWFVPGLLRLAENLGGLVEGGTALHSVIDVRALGVALSALALQTDELQSSVYHAAGAEAPSVREILVALAPDAEFMNRSLSRGEAESLLVQRGLSSRQIRLVSTQHTYNSTLLSDAIAGDLGKGFALSDGQREWYQGLNGR